MATYGAPIPSDVVKSKIDGVDYYTIASTRLSTDGKTETTILYSPKPGSFLGIPGIGAGNYIPAATTTDGGKTWNYAKYKQGDDIPSGKKVGDEIFGNQAKKSLEGGALKTNSNNAIVTALKKEGVPPEQQKQAALNQNTASPTGDPLVAGDAATATADQVQQLIADAGKYKGRHDYPQSLKYPIQMNDNQDCMKFTIIEYVPSNLGIGAQDATLRTSASKNKNQKILTTITLPMPSGGISDRNYVDWQNDSLDPLQGGFADVAMKMIVGGGDTGADSFKKQLEAATAKEGKSALTALIAIKASEQAVGANNLLGRVAGLAINPNLELLFNGPQLRDFSFSFKMTPRSKKEAQMVRSIIRTFKQAMSVKRSQSVLLLKAPHTFRISYLTSTKDHPYLNRFKECALTNCSVNYTPDGQYMSYDDSNPDGRSMTAYELSLSFNELEPIFDDDYETMEGAVGSFGHIGY